MISLLWSISVTSVIFSVFFVVNPDSYRDHRGHKVFSQSTQRDYLVDFAAKLIIWAHNFIVLILYMYSYTVNFFKPVCLYFVSYQIQ